MSEQSQGPGWWYASDGKWYPPETHPEYRPPPAPPRPAPPLAKGLAWAVALALASVLLIGSLTVFLVVTQEGSNDGGFSSEVDLDDEGASDLDDLYDACDGGDMEACDDLYFDSPLGSDEEEFGSTCGDRRSETRGDCA